eukprot:CAMPEP_0204829186 /NCGR_PEP_ID=MMETSP1346-20131115/7243_1 /ASSEMBLY_ACC=CAM_ASM_000771 /TAXON_ID=215587 /ORGANISM="Aplanochytrium stocchinoi, Strain GSBS06" /LENGTH=54 /DNA_ID=CAMNT_0051958759 /DNA_START=26 /DNA_END=186 /DNA_ORIENTATION=+
MPKQRSNPASSAASAAALQRARISGTGFIGFGAFASNDTGTVAEDNSGGSAGKA